MNDTIPGTAREKNAESLFSKILESPEACERLSEVFYDHLNDDHLVVDPDPDHFAKILFAAYKQQDVGVLLLELFQRSLFDLLREAGLIPRKFHGKAGENPVLLTDGEGNLLKGKNSFVGHLEYGRFREIWSRHQCLPGSSLYLADGYDMAREYTEKLDIKESLENRKRGILCLYTLPEAAGLGMTEEQVYAAVWDGFLKIQNSIPSAIVYYGQESGEKKDRDEIGVLLPLHQMEKPTLAHLAKADRIISECIEEMTKKA